MNLIERLRRITREEWEELIKRRFIDLRIWIQEHPERASVLSLLAGIVFVLLFKLVMWIVIILGLVVFVLWYFAPCGEKG